MGDHRHGIGSLVEHVADLVTDELEHVARMCEQVHPDDDYNTAEIHAGHYEYAHSVERGGVQLLRVENVEEDNVVGYESPHREREEGEHK